MNKINIVHTLFVLCLAFGVFRLNVSAVETQNSLPANLQSRPGAERVTLWVEHYCVPCVGAGDPQWCYLTREGASKHEATYFYEDIAGFKYQWGHRYRLRALKLKVDRPPADAPSVTYRLLKIISDERVAPTLTFEIPLKLPGAAPVLSHDAKSGIRLLGEKRVIVTSAKLKARLLRSAESAVSLRGTFRHAFGRRHSLILVNLREE